MQTELERKYHNPSVESGAEVISQYLDDEEQGLPVDRFNNGKYKLEITEAVKVKLESEDGKYILYEDLDRFMRKGIIGGQRFTVIGEVKK